MKKVTIKLKRSDLETLVQLLGAVVFNPKSYGYTNIDNDKLIIACLIELHEKIRNAINVYDTGNPTHKLKISVAQAMAFSIHFKALPDGNVPQSEEVTINNILGLIDQQTPYNG